MADAKATISSAQNLANNSTIELYGLLKVTAGPDTYPAGGLPLDLVGSSVGVSSPPLSVTISTTHQGSSANVYIYDYTNKKVRIYTGASSGPPGAAELTTGAAIPADVSGASARVMATFAKFQ